MTANQAALLARLARAGGAAHVRGAGEVGVARALAARGLVTLADDGVGPRVNGRVDGERWTATLTAAGRARAIAMFAEADRDQLRAERDAARAALSRIAEDEARHEASCAARRDAPEPCDCDLAPYASGAF